jgi:hypothetical protein
MKVVMAEEAAGQVKPGATSNRPGDVPRTPSKQRVPLSTPKAAAGQSSSSPWNTQPHQQGGDQTPLASPPGLPSLQPSTPQKQKEPPRMPGRAPSSGQLTNATPMKQAQSPGSSTAATPGPIMGPTITPTRLPSASSKNTIGQRNTSYVIISIPPHYLCL